ncbi:hypothetical protein JCM10212_003626 [Sporobolomyces blumeae]
MPLTAPQGFQLGSRWPLWGEDVLLELAFHRRALDEGFVPREWTPPGADPARTHWYECFWNAESPAGGCCPYHIRLDQRADQNCKITTEVQLQHAHPLEPLSDDYRSEAEKKIRALEREVRRSAVLELKRIKKEAEGNGERDAVSRKKQTQVLADVVFALGSSEVEPLPTPSLSKAPSISQSPALRESESTPAARLTRASARRNGSLLDVSVLDAGGARPDPSPKPSNGSSTPSRPPWPDISTMQQDLAARFDVVPLDEDTEHRLRTSLPPFLFRCVEPGCDYLLLVNDADDGAYDVHLASSNLAHNHPLASEASAAVNAEQALRAPPQSSLVLKRAASLRSLEGEPSAKRFGPTATPTPTPTPTFTRNQKRGSRSTLMQSPPKGLRSPTTAASPSLDPSSTLTLPKNPTWASPRPTIAAAQPEKPVTWSNAIASTSSVRLESHEHVRTGFADEEENSETEHDIWHEAAANQIEREEHAQRFREDGTSRKSFATAPPRIKPEYVESRLSEDRPCRPSLRPSETLEVYLSTLDTSCAYDFSCYLEPLERGSIATPAQLRVFISNEKRFEMILRELEAHDTREGVDTGKWRREMFKDLLRESLR